MSMKAEQTGLHVTTQLQQYENHLDPNFSYGDWPRLWTDLKK